METESLNLICCPRCNRKLNIQVPCLQVNGLEKCLYCSHCQVLFPVVNGLPAFVSKEEQISYGKRMDFMRALYAAFYTPLTDSFFNLFCGGAAASRREVIDRLEIPVGGLVLETGIGTGDNLPYLRSLNGACAYFGIDNQYKMLKQCSHNLRHWKMNAELFLADAERLPFRDHSFDVVFHLGAINIFPDKRKAISEMIRVAKPGTKIVIADESQKTGRIFDFFLGKQPEIVPPVDLIPPEMLEVRCDSIWKGYGYLIEFRIPLPCQG